MVIYEIYSAIFIFQCPNISSYQSDCPTWAYCTCAHQYDIIFAMINNTKLLYLHNFKGRFSVGVGVDINKAQSDK